MFYKRESLKTVAKTAFIALAATVMLESCVKDYFELDKLSTDQEWDPTIAVPLVSSSLEMTELLGVEETETELGSLEIGSNGALTLVYKGSVETSDFLSAEKDTIDIAILSEVSGQGLISLVDPKIVFTSRNSFGYNINATVTQLDGENLDGIYPITSSLDPIDIPVQVPSSSQQGQTLSDSSTVLNSGNSNFNDVITNSRPWLINFEVAFAPDTATIPPNFYSNNAKVKVDVDIEFPLNGALKDVEFLDTIADFEIEGASDPSVSSGLIRLITSNGLPLDMSMQVYFVDEQYTVLDSIFSKPDFIKSGNINATTLKLEAPVELTTDAVLDRAKLDKLENTKNLIIKTIANTQNAGTENVVLYEDYGLDIKLGIQLQVDPKF